MAKELNEWRECFTINDAKDACRNIEQDKYSVAVLASGGLLDTLSAIRAGMCPIWGSEVDPTMQSMWQDLTANKCYGDAYKINYNIVRRPMVLKTGFPCIDYSPLGRTKGADGRTGQLYRNQGGIINKVEPAIAILEQTSNVVNVNDGLEVKQLIQELQTKYEVHCQAIKVWKYGVTPATARGYS